MLAVALLLACRPGASGPPADPDFLPYDPLPYVDPLTGTGGIGAQVAGVTPGAAWPNGITRVGPDTRHSVTGAPGFYHFGGYHWDDDRIAGFSHTHAQGMGVNDFGAIHLMPRAAWRPELTGAVGRMAPFSHDREWASPGRYAVDLLDDEVQVEIVATPHGAIHRYAFPADAPAPTVVLDLGHRLGTVDIGPATWAALDPATGTIGGLQVIDGGYSARIGGMQNHFELRFDPAPTAWGAWDDPASPVAGATATAGTAGGLWVSFPAGTAEVVVRAGLSIVDRAGAAANLDAELPDGDLEARLAEVEAAWRERLSVARVWGDEADRGRFHSAHYQALLMPTRYDDVDGRTRGVDGEIGTPGFPYYSDLSLWDTFRTLHPWYVLVHPDLQRDVARSLARMTEDVGAVPRWPLAHGTTGGMIGSPGCIVLVDTWRAGLTEGWDVEGVFEACLAQATGPTPPVSRGNVEDYVTYGYVPAPASGSTSQTLEYAWADFALADLARGLGRQADAERLAAQAESWRALWDPVERFHRSPDRDGVFPEFEGPLYWGEEYVEGNAWHYLWTVPQDVDGMIEVQDGGDRGAFHDRLRAYWEGVALEPDDDFPDDLYWHGNEPVLHYASLGSLSGEPRITADASRWILTHRYPPGPEGLDGNDDAGTLSAWYLLTAIGLYPVAGTPVWALGSPIFERVELDRPQGTLVIEAPGTSDEVWAPVQVTVDGAPLEGWTLDTAALLEAGRIGFLLER